MAPSLNYKKKKRVAFFGDSICVGQGFSLHKGWVTRVAKYLEESAGDFEWEIEVMNSSVNGRTTRQALEDMPYHIQTQQIDVLIIQFGLNDCNYWQTDPGVPRVSREAFKANLKEMLDRAFKSGVDIVLLNNNHPTPRTEIIDNERHLTFEESNASYCLSVAEVAGEQKSGVMFTDIHSLISQRCKDQNISPSDFVLQDGIHLSESGHDIYYEILLPVIKKAIASLGSTEK